MARENYEVTVYAPDEENFDTEGLCGALECLSCVQTEAAIEAGGEDEIEIVVAYDAAGKWQNVATGNLLRCYVQKRTPPDITAEGEIVTSVEIWKVAENAAKADRYVYKAATGTKKLKMLDIGTEVVVTEAPSTGRYRVLSSVANGYMNPAGLSYETAQVIPETPTGIETVLPGAKIKAEIYEITHIEPGESSLTAYARHQSYRLEMNCATYETAQTVTIREAANGILDGCEDDTHGCAVFSDMADTRTGISFVDENPLKCFFDPEEGLVAKWPCEVLRDGSDIYFLSSVGMDRGVTIEPGKNLAGVDITEDIDGVYTYIKPIGKNKDGSRLYLPETYVVSPYADEYAYKRIYAFEAKDCTVGTNGTESEVLAEMRRQANALISEGIDIPSVTMQANVAQTDGVAGLEIVEQLEPLLIYDYVKFVTPRFRTMVYQRILRRQWDCLHGRLLSVETGMVEDLSRVSVNSYQIPPVNGNKLIGGSVGAGALAGDAISARHLQVASVNADAIAANSVTAGKIAAGAVTAGTIASEAVTAGTIAAGAVTSGTIAAGAVKADNVDAGAITTAKLAAGAVTAAKMQTGTITAESGIIADSAIQTAQIADGSITAAKVVSLNADTITAGTLSVNRLIIVGDDGLIYRINAESGDLSPEVLSGDDYKNQLSGTVIVAKSITADQIAAAAITANEILSGTITADKLNVSELFANAAFIAALTTSSIFAGGGSLSILAQTVTDTETDLQNNFVFDAAEGLVIRKITDGQESAYYTVTGNNGYYVRNRLSLGFDGNHTVMRATEDGVTANALQIGVLRVRRKSNGWVWTDAN